MKALNIPCNIILLVVLVTTNTAMDPPRQQDHRRLIREEFRRQQQQLALQTPPRQSERREEPGSGKGPARHEDTPPQTPTVNPEAELFEVHSLLENLCRSLNVNPACLATGRPMSHPPVAARNSRQEGPLDVSPSDTMMERLAKMLVRIMRRGFTDRFDRHMPTPQQVLRILEILDDPNEGDVIVPAYTMRWLGNAAGLHLGSDLTRRTPVRYEPMSVREMVESTLQEYENYRGERISLIHPDLRRIFLCSGIDFEELIARYNLDFNWMIPVPEDMHIVSQVEQRRERMRRRRNLISTPVFSTSSVSSTQIVGPSSVSSSELLSPSMSSSTNVVMPQSSDPLPPNFLDQFRFSPPSPRTPQLPLVRLAKKDTDKEKEDSDDDPFKEN